MKGSWVTAKMAGTESTAKTRSTNSTMMSATKSGVMKRASLPVLGSTCFTVNFSP